MAEPATPQHQLLPPPYVSVQPRSRRPHGGYRRAPPPNEEWPVYGPEDLSPYPLWAVLIVRGSLTAFGIAVLGYVAYVHASAASLGLRSDSAAAIAGAALAVLFDGILTMFAAVGAYEAGTSCTSGFLDVVPGVVCLVGAFAMSWLERHQEEWYDSYYAARSLAATLLIVLGVVHILSSISGCVGCCITSTRRGRAKREKRMIEAAITGAREAAQPPQAPAGAAIPLSTLPGGVPVEEAQKMEPDPPGYVERAASGAEERNPNGNTVQKP